MGIIDGIANSDQTQVLPNLKIARAHIGYDIGKRILDIWVSAAALAVFSPFIAAGALAIKFDSEGPVFHRRKVVGRGGRSFNAFKLRTMHVNMAVPCTTEFCERQKLKEDPRTTRVGRFLRKVSIDEIPQLINVLRGEMSLVGPRMISFPELEKFGMWQDKILSVKPGITGLWQVSGRSDLPYEERVRLNVYYVDNRSLWMDISILLKTIPAVLSMRGAY